jgi:hypothetical protein
MATLTTPFGDAILDFLRHTVMAWWPMRSFPQAGNVQGASTTFDPRGQLGNFSVDCHRIFDGTAAHG